MPRQDSTTDQMYDLLRLANAEGLYDAAQWIEDHFPGIATTRRQEQFVFGPTAVPE